jgi:hypothetical protein
MFSANKLQEHEKDPFPLDWITMKVYEKKIWKNFKEKTVLYKHQKARKKLAVAPVNEENTTKHQYDKKNKCFYKSQDFTCIRYELMRRSDLLIRIFPKK